MEPHWEQWASHRSGPFPPGSLPAAASCTCTRVSGGGTAASACSLDVCLTLVQAHLLARLQLQGLNHGPLPFRPLRGLRPRNAAQHPALSTPETLAEAGSAHLARLGLGALAGGRGTRGFAAFALAGSAVRHSLPVHGHPLGQRSGRPAGASTLHLFSFIVKMCASCSPALLQGTQQLQAVGGSGFLFWLDFLPQCSATTPIGCVRSTIKHAGAGPRILHGAGF